MEHETNDVPAASLGAYAKRGRRSGTPKAAGSGRKVGSLNKRTRTALEIVETFGQHPAAILCAAAVDGVLLDKDGTVTKLTADQRLKAAQALLPFILPRLESVESKITAEVEQKPADFDWHRFMDAAARMPGGLQALERLAFEAYGLEYPEYPRPAAQIPGPAPVDATAEPAEPRDFISDALARDHKGHWRSR